jgi:hypothetical protein
VWVRMKALQDALSHDPVKTTHIFRAQIRSPAGGITLFEWFWLLLNSVRASSIGSSPKELVHSDYGMWLDPPG